MTDRNLPYTRAAVTVAGSHRLLTRSFPNFAMRCEVGTTNLVTNPSFETNTTGHAASGTNTIARSTTITAKFGTYSLKCTYVDSLTLDSYAITLTAAAHMVSVYLYIPSNWNGTQIRVNATGFAGASGTITANADMSLRTQWQRVTVGPFTPAGGDLVGTITIDDTGAPTVNRFIYVDGLQVEASSYATTYCDGSRGYGHAWTDSAHACTSTRAATSLRISADDTDFLVPAYAFGLAFWFTPLLSRSSGYGSQYLFSRYLALYYYNANTRFTLKDYTNLGGGEGGGTYQVHVTHTTVAETPVFIAASSNVTAGKLSLSVNGAARSEATLLLVGTRVTGPSYLGSVGGTATHLNADINAVAFSKNAISDTEAAALYALTRPPATGEILGKYMTGVWAPTKPYVQVNTSAKAVV